MDKVFLDINIFQDVLSARSGYDASYYLIELIRQKKLKGYCASFTIPTLWYLNRKAERPREKILILLKGIRIVALTPMMVRRALVRRSFGDLEDELQYRCAESAGCNVLITRNLGDFPKRPLHLFAPEAYLNSLT